MHEHVLNAVLESDGRRRAPRARALELQVHDAVLEASEHNVAAVHRDRGSDPCVQQLLDHGHGLRVLGLNLCVLRLRRGCVCAEQWGARRVEVHDHGENLRLERRPLVRVFLRHRHVVFAEENGRDALDAEELRRERRHCGLPDRRELARRLVTHDRSLRKELERRGVRRLCRPDEHMRSGAAMKRGKRALRAHDKMSGT
eukprot:Amastigsp_a869687_8.p2 type:complete len:200 gc:universal Amastigsp_a869687_8:629-30(-)